MTTVAQEPGTLAVRRDLGEAELWERSLARSRARRVAGRTKRSLVSAALADLDGPALVPVPASERDLSSEDLWTLAQACAEGRRRAARRPALAQARSAGATLLVAAVAAAVPAQSSGHARGGGSGGKAAHLDPRLLFAGMRGRDVARAQRALGIPADGIFGPQTRRAVKRFQRSQGLVVDGVVGPQTRAALSASRADGPRMFRAPWVDDVQRKLGVPADGVFGPQTRAAVKRFQRAHGLVVDGIVGPQTLGALGLPGTGQTKPKGGSTSQPARGAGAVVAAARAQIGKPYGWGGNGPGAFDCSGLTVWAFRAAGISLPRTSFAQFGSGRAVSRSKIRAGDLVFFSTAGPGASHVGIAVGRSTFVSATSHGVRVQPIGGSYWGAAYVGARRVL